MNQQISIKTALEHAVQGSILFKPNDFPDVNVTAELEEGTAIEVMNETTLHAAQRKYHQYPEDHTLALNFASARNPGGGFLTGAQAQEESLARASGLYSCIEQMDEMYKFNQTNRSMFYSDYLIYSPAIPVFRDEKDKFLDDHYPLSIISAPAVNAGEVLRWVKPDDIDDVQAEIDKTMARRIKNVLTVAAAHNSSILILGAWGCGVFRNDPKLIARLFSQHLVTGDFKNTFKAVVFAISDRSRNKNVLRAFQDEFAS